MKVLLAVCCLLLFKWDESLLVLDKNFKKPVQKATAFTTEQYLQQCFPVYVADVPSIIRSADLAVKLLDKQLPCNFSDTVTSAHTTIVILTDCEEVPGISIFIYTTIKETATSYSFALVSRENNWRRAQQKLLHFATYIDQ